MGDFFEIFETLAQKWWWFSSGGPRISVIPFFLLGAVSLRTGLDIAPRELGTRRWTRGGSSAPQAEGAVACAAEQRTEKVMEQKP